jgi:hypothetical protein
VTFKFNARLSADKGERHDAPVLTHIGDPGYLHEVAEANGDTLWTRYAPASRLVASEQRPTIASEKPVGVG